MFKKRNYEENPQQEPHKWKQKEGSTCDDIIFTNGIREISFDEWIVCRQMNLNFSGQKIKECLANLV
jgi:hypothetical protein